MFVPFLTNSAAPKDCLSFDASYSRCFESGVVCFEENATPAMEIAWSRKRRCYPTPEGVVNCVYIII